MSNFWEWRVPVRARVVPVACPVCAGMGKVAWPPHAAYGCAWTDTNTGPWECPKCKGAMILYVQETEGWSLDD